VGRKKQLSADLTLVLDHVEALTKPVLAAWLKERGLAKSGTKEAQRTRIEDALQDGRLKPTDLTALLDEQVPWGKQHVFLQGAASSPPGRLRDSASFEKHLREHDIPVSLLQTSPDVLLPEELQLIRIEHSVSALRVTAIERREGLFRETEYDEVSDDHKIVYKAYRRETVRGYTVFEWDFTTNTAAIHISQLPAHASYDDARARLTSLLSSWLPIHSFPDFDLRKSLRVLHKEEEAGSSLTRSQSIEYNTLKNRRMGAKHSSVGGGLVGEPIVDAAMKAVRQSGTPRQANLYWLQSPAKPDEVHVYVHAENKRVSFPTNNDEPCVRYVLRELRKADSRPD
jgi:hypothetical protein